MKHTLFWGTTLTWALLMITVAGRALIIGERQGVQRLGQFSAKINGTSQKHEIWSSRDGLDSFRNLRKSWIEKGWSPASEGLELTAALLDLSQEESLLTSRIRTAVFKRKDDLRLLASLQNGDATYAWKAEMSGPFDQRNSCARKWGFPLRPSDSAQQALCITSGPLRFAHWRQDVCNDSLPRLAKAQGYDCRVYDVLKEGTLWILTKGSRCILATTRSKDGRTDISLMLIRP